MTLDTRSILGLNGKIDTQTKLISEKATIGKNVRISCGAVIHDNVILGNDVFVGPYASIGEPLYGFYQDPDNYDNPETKIGDHSIIRSHTVIYAHNHIGSHLQTGHMAVIREKNNIGNNVGIGISTDIEPRNVIQDGVRIHSNCLIGEFVEIQKNAWLGPHVVTLADLHPPCPKHEECVSGGHNIVIGEGAKVGGNVTISPGVHIGRRALVGCGAVLVKDVPNEAVVVGNPGKEIKNIGQLACPRGLYERPFAGW